METEGLIALVAGFLILVVFITWLSIKTKKEPIGGQELKNMKSKKQLKKYLR
jgi:hypothetical protein